MAPSAIYNNNFLNSLFTTKEFDFLNHMDSDSQKIDSMIKKEENNRDLIVTFINNLHDAVSTHPESEQSISVSKLLSDVQNIFELVNENIENLQKNKETTLAINQAMVDLLIRIESEKDPHEEKFENEILDLKDKITDFSTVLEKSKSTIILNDIKIDNFLQQSIVKKYLSAFSMEIEPAKISQTSFKKTSDLNSAILNIPADIEENNSTLLVSETKKKVYLPYSKNEVLEYLEQYPNQYRSFADVVKQEFIYPIDFYLKHPVIARFRETYALIRDRESKSVIEAFKYAMDMMFHYDLNPTIIAACKTQDQLENYLSCLERKKLDEFTDFEIKFEINPF